MSYHAKWERLKEKLLELSTFNKSGEMQLMAESIHGKSKCSEILLLMEKIEHEAAEDGGDFCDCGRITTEGFVYGDGIQMQSQMCTDGMQWTIGCKDVWGDEYTMVMDKQFKYCPWCEKPLPQG